jgi:hypothetical protein
VPSSHYDGAALCLLYRYGDVIITVTIFGEVEIELVDDNERGKGRSELLPIDRATTVQTGVAYGIWGKGRWKMKHNAILPPRVPAVQGLVGNIARVGVTFRYNRRSFFELRRRNSSLVSSPLQPLPQPLDLVDAVFFSDGKPSNAHLYTYPAIVLCVDAAERRLTLHYLSDGLIADTDEEAFAIAEVPASSTVPATSAVKAWLRNSQCPWTICSYRLIEHIHAIGPEAFLQQRNQ